MLSPPSILSPSVLIPILPKTFGNAFEVDGHLKGDLEVVTVPCDQASNTCQIRVPAPGFALVFINGNPEVEESDITFSTTAFTKLMNTATVDPAVLETSNGMSGKDREKMGSTSFGSVDNGASAVIHGYVSVVTAVTTMMAGWILLRHVI